MVIANLKEDSMSGADHSSAHNSKRNRNIGIVLLLIILGAIVVPWLYNQPWSGFGEVQTTTVTTEQISFVTGAKTTMSTVTQPAKSPWDWMELLIVPLILAVAAYWFNHSEHERDNRVAAEQAEKDALQAYLDHMSKLLLENKTAAPKPEPPVGALKAEASGSTPKLESHALVLAKTYTHDVLHQLNGNRKGTVIRFLYESDLIGAWKNSDPIINRWEPEELSSCIDLRGASLDGTNLRLGKFEGVNLKLAELKKADLSGVWLKKARLGGADLTGANLFFADLISADLSNAKLISAQLGKAWLDSANLEGAQLMNANLEQASLEKANLQYTDLTNANISEEQLKECDSLYGAKMQDGKRYDGRYNLSGDKKRAEKEPVNT
jgi:hypothetical protein